MTSKKWRFFYVVVVPAETHLCYWLREWSRHPESEVELLRMEVHATGEYLRVEGDVAYSSRVELLE